MARLARVRICACVFEDILEGRSLPAPCPVALAEPFPTPPQRSKVALLPHNTFNECCFSFAFKEKKAVQEARPSPFSPPPHSSELRPFSIALPLYNRRQAYCARTAFRDSIETAGRCLFSSDVHTHIIRPQQLPFPSYKRKDKVQFRFLSYC